MAADNSKYKMSQERYDEIKKELHYLETVREKEVSELIKEARSFGDLSENSEYDEAKTEQGKLYSKIAELKALIEKAEIIEKTELDGGTVALSSRIKLLDVDENEELEYQIVGSQEANKQLFDLIVRLQEEGRIAFDQLLDESNYAWVHVSYRAGRNRGQILHLK